MLSTAIFLTALLCFFVVALLLRVLFLRWGIRWAKIGNVTMAGATGIVMLMVLADCLVAAGFYLLSSRLQATAVDLIGFVVELLLPCVIIALIFKARFLKAVQAYLPSLIPAVVLPLFAVFVIRPFFYEAFTCPTNAMAPTLLGPHWEGVCPRCGHAAYASVPMGTGRIPPQGLLMICSSELRSCLVSDLDRQPREGDRFLVSKFLSFGRWDIIVFRFPEDPSQYYAKRVIGLPGERVAIHDGNIWIDGQICPPPDSLRGIEYLDAVASLPLAWGHENNPATLGPDEYFVLGDFSAQSRDSRFWRRGAPGHAPYAVPASHIIGVVTHIYWPIDRWRILR
jgi:signal peptidase I